MLYRVERHSVAIAGATAVKERRQKPRSWRARDESVEVKSEAARVNPDQVLIDRLLRLAAED